MGLQVAFAITAYDGNTESIEDEDIGVLKAFFISWGENYVDYNIQETVQVQTLDYHQIGRYKRTKTCLLVVIPSSTL